MRPIMLGRPQIPGIRGKDRSDLYRRIPHIFPSVPFLPASRTIRLRLPLFLRCGTIPAQSPADDIPSVRPSHIARPSLFPFLSDIKSPQACPQHRRRKTIDRDFLKYSSPLLPGYQTILEAPPEPAVLSSVFLRYLLPDIGAVKIYAQIYLQAPAE